MRRCPIATGHLGDTVERSTAVILEDGIPVFGIDTGRLVGQKRKNEAFAFAAYLDFVVGSHEVDGIVPPHGPSMESRRFLVALADAVASDERWSKKWLAERAAVEYFVDVRALLTESVEERLTRASDGTSLEIRPITSVTRRARSTP